MTIPAATHPVHYLDHAATTPVLPAVVEVVAEVMRTPGNAGSLHGSGRRARKLIEESREAVAAALGARPSEVIFTSGGTESDNLAVKGIFWARRAADPRRTRIVIGASEHHAVLDPAEWLVEHDGATIDILAVDRDGVIDPADLERLLAAVGDEVALISVMWANNEVGAINPVAELAAVAHRHGVPLHTDAVQAVAQLPVHVGESGVDALTLTAHKLGGPYGAGALILGRDVACTPLLHGGGQERDVRSGTLDTASVVGFATALTAAVAERDARAVELARLRDRLVAGVRHQVPDVVLNGPDPAHRDRLPGNAHLSVPGCEGDSLLMLLDARGIECSTGSACTSGVAQPSHVLLAMGVAPSDARGSLRFSLGHTSTDADIDAVLDAFGPVVERARRAGLAAAG